MPIIRRVYSSIGAFRKTSGSVPGLSDSDPLPYQVGAERCGGAASLGAQFRKNKSHSRAPRIDETRGVRYGAIAGRESLGKLPARVNRPDFIMCGSDRPALGVLLEAAARGLRIPGFRAFRLRRHAVFSRGHATLE